MKYFLFIVVLLMCNQSKTDKDKIDNFSKNLINIISERNICELSNVKVFPQENAITLRAIDYILGNEHQTGFVKLFQNKNLKTEIYGPYEVGIEKYYYLIYYDPNRIKQDDKGNIDSYERKQNWGKYYVETLVTVIDSEVYFYRTPFFYETDIAW